MATSDADLWHQVHAQREDGVPAMFLIREVEPRPDQPQIFVVELPYPVTDLSKLPDATGYRRLDTFQEQWIEPACDALGWTFVAWKSEDGSFFIYLYGDGDPNVLLERLAPFDGALGFFNDNDPDWAEYGALRQLVEQAQSAPDDDDDDDDDEHAHVHTDDCDHDHEHAHDATSNGISVIDLTGARPAAKAKPAKAKPATAKTAKARTAKASSAKPAVKAKAPAAKPVTAKPAKGKAPPARQATTKAATRAAPSKAVPPKATTKRADTKKPIPGKPATRTAAKPATASKPAKAKPAAKKSAARKATFRR